MVVSSVTLQASPTLRTAALVYGHERARIAADQCAAPRSPVGPRRLLAFEDLGFSKCVVRLLEDQAKDDADHEDTLE